MVTPRVDCRSLFNNLYLVLTTFYILLTVLIRIFHQKFKITPRIISLMNNSKNWQKLCKCKTWILSGNILNSFQAEQWPLNRGSSLFKERIRGGAFISWGWGGDRFRCSSNSLLVILEPVSVLKCLFNHLKTGIN